MASKHRASDGQEEPSGKRAKISSPKPALNRVDCNLDFTIEVDGVSGRALHNEGFAYCWSGARANIGISRGKYCFGCRVVENQTVTMEDTPKDQQNVSRVGISRGDSDVGSLGETGNSFGYGGTGKFSHSGVFTNYGERYGVGDTIICAINLEHHSAARISFAKNGKWLGDAMVFDAGTRGADVIGATDYKRAIFPHVLLKNVKVRVMLSIDHGLEPLEGYKPWDCAIVDGNAVEGPKPVDSRDQEVIMMVGLPGSGKTTWAEKYARELPDKRYMLLGTNLALDQMKVPGLLRKRNYGERFERLMDRATKIFNQLSQIASRTPRNFIIDQTNVYRSARIRKLKPFRDFYKIAVVVFPHADELRRRTLARSMDMGKEVPREAVNEMLANFILPTSKGMLNSIEPFDEVRFTELQRDDAEKHLVEMKGALPAAPSKKPESTPSQSCQGFMVDRNAREASIGSMQGNYMSPYDWNTREAALASMRGSYTSSYELQNYNAREPSHMPISHSPLSQISCGSAPQVPYGSPCQGLYSSTVPNYSSSLDRTSAMPYAKGQLDDYNSQGSYYSRENSVPSYLGNMDPLVAGGYYSRGNSIHSYRDDHQGYPRERLTEAYYPRESSLNHLGDRYGIPSQGPYGSSSCISGHEMPPQTLHSRLPATSYTQDFTGYTGYTGMQSQPPPFGDPGLVGPPSSGAGHPGPDMPRQYRY